MVDFKLHDRNSAPEGSRPLLDSSMKELGMIPNLYAVMAAAPGLLEGYQHLNKLFTETSFNADEQTVVWQSINVEHNCHYCVPAHTGIARQMNVDDEISDALRNETRLPTEKLEALRDFTLSVVRKRGEVDDAAVQSFLDAGYSRQQVLEVVLGVAQKTMSNYTNHLAETPVDSAFEQFEWQKVA